MDEKQELTNLRLLREEISSEISFWLNPEDKRGSMPGMQLRFHSVEKDRNLLMLRLNYLLKMSQEPDFTAIIQRGTGALKFRNKMHPKTIQWVQQNYDPSTREDRTLRMLSNACAHSPASIMAAVHKSADEIADYEAREAWRDAVTVKHINR